jgi:hypothetical protein
MREPGKAVRLTDYFADDDIIRELLADRVIKKALADLNIASRPKTLAQLVRLFAANDHVLGDSDFELRRDFLTRFAFHL